MQIIVLGQHQQDVGKQLEQLTGEILGYLDYSNITFNDRGRGGNEIDVTAEHTQQSIGQGFKRELICECKAYSDPVAMPDWLKFLGKIFTKELGSNRVNGCFIALSGVNGNVRGHYRDLRTFRPDIEIVTSEEISVQFTKQFALVTSDAAIMSIQTMTTPVLCFVEYVPQ